eukprot:TRINITY_DN1893_c5_g1_i1.p1 TRINITY_DN1893_c5_g1~~TRINITY_DN1893_c5_g1_i1.p1  ORF type:complete len:910 (-),score=342.99 TRINITY_DN1893_c5_g1_i1:21-2588(-)
MAFDEEDYNKYGDVGSNISGRKRTRDEVESDGDDEGDDDDMDGSSYKTLSDLLDDDADSSGKVDVQRHQEMLNKIDQIGKPAKKKARIEVSSVGKEGDFGVSAGDTKITLDDLMDGLSGSAEFSHIRKQVEKLERAQDKNKVPLPQSKVVKDRELRKAQYEHTATEVSTWQPTVNRMLEAPHLSFPLDQPTTPKRSAAEMASTFKPSTDLEKQIAGVLNQSGLTEDKVIEAEQLAERKMTMKEIRDKEAQLAKMRHLMFYKEKKLQRQNKIKSKKYRKILRKQKEKFKLTIEELRELDPAAANEEADKQSKSRALERMTMKHKTVGKWAEGAKRSKNPLLKQQLQESHKLGEELRKKIDRVAVDSDDDDDDDDDDDKSQEDLEDNNNMEEDEPKKGLFAMQFMKRAQQKGVAEYQELKQRMEEELNDRVKKLEDHADKLYGGRSSKEDGNDDGDDDGKPSKPSKVVDGQQESAPVKGRQSFAGSSKSNFQSESVNQSEVGFDELVASGVGGSFTSKIDKPIIIETKKSNKKAAESKPLPKVFDVPEFPTVAMEEASEQSATTTTYSINKEKVVGGGPNNLKSTKSKDNLPEMPESTNKSTEDTNNNNNDNKAKTTKQQSKKSNTESNPWMQDQDDDDEEKIIMINSKDKKSKKKNKNKTLQDSTRVNLDLEKLESTVSQQNRANEHEFDLAENTSETQQEIIARAFENDDIQSEFDLEKQRAIERDMPKQKLDLTMPGWGGWAGEGLEWKPNKRDKKKIEMRKMKEEELKAKRRDAKLAHVIVNEKMDKKSQYLTLEKVPHPFKSREAYERSLRNPLGKEWNTDNTHRKLTRPRIKSTTGTVIEPIKKKISKKTD